MNNPQQQQPKLDTPIGLKYIKELAEKFTASNIKPPAGDHWQNNLSADYYLGMLTSLNLAMTGLVSMQGSENANLESLINELNTVCGELCVKIVEKTSKIITLDQQ